MTTLNQLCTTARSLTSLLWAIWADLEAARCGYAVIGPDQTAQMLENARQARATLREILPQLCTEEAELSIDYHKKFVPHHSEHHKQYMRDMIHRVEATRLSVIRALALEIEGLS